MIEILPAIHSKQLTAQPDGSVTVSILDPTGILCRNPDRPAIVGDVYSMQPDGSMQARPAGTAGPWELARVNGNALAFAPQGKDGPAYIMPFMLSIPNA